MNWVDFFIAVVLLITIGIGFKQGLFRSIFTLLGLIVATIVTFTYADWLAIQIEGMFNIAPSLRYVFCFVALFLVMVAVLKIISNFFYKMARLTPLKYPDMIGGGLFGMFRGVVILSMIFLMFIFFPAFQKFNQSIDESMLAPHIRQVVPVVFDMTDIFHPESGPFIYKLARGILGSKTDKYADNPKSLLGKNEVLGLSHKDIGVLDNIEKYFGETIELAKKENKE